MRADLRGLVTRPEGSAQALIAGLNRLGFTVTHLPMLALEPIDPLPPAERQRILDLDLYQHLVFISANAARFGLAAIDDCWAQYPTGQQCWAVGESTARTLEAVGLAVNRPEHDMSSEGLLALEGLQAVAGDKVLIIKGEGGRDTLRRQLQARGAMVHTLSCYRRVAPDYRDSDVLRHLCEEPPGLVLISSGEGLGNLSRLLQPRENTNLASIALIVPSARVAEEAAQLGWRCVSCADNAADASMLDAAERWARRSESEGAGESSIID